MQAFPFLVRGGVFGSWYCRILLPPVQLQPNIRPTPEWSNVHAPSSLELGINALHSQGTLSCCYISFLSVKLLVFTLVLEFFSVAVLLFFLGFHGYLAALIVCFRTKSDFLLLRSLPKLANFANFAAWAFYSMVSRSHMKRSRNWEGHQPLQPDFCMRTRLNLSDALKLLSYK